MTCKKDPYDKCTCLKRKGSGCVDCEKSAIRAVKKSGRNLNETVKYVKESGDIIDDLYISVDGFDGDPRSFALRSSIDILRGICKYCMYDTSDVCNECMWMNNSAGKDYWLFDERFVKDS